MGKNRPLSEVPPETIEAAVADVLDGRRSIPEAAAEAGIAAGSLRKIINHVPPEELPFTGYWVRIRGVLRPDPTTFNRQKAGVS